MTDHLAPLPVAQVHAWYRRLAASIRRQTVPDGRTGRTPLAAIFLDEYLNARSSGVFTFSAPNYLKNASQVLAALRYHREVFLSSSPARIGSTTRIAGVLPRLRGTGTYTRWRPGTPLRMQYHSLVEIGSSPVDIARIQTLGTPQERDLFTALRGFQLQSTVQLSGVQNGGNVDITFDSWEVHAFDRYDFDYSEHLTLPNPDYQSTAAGAVRPQDDRITVYHTNARRMVRAGLAAPYDLASQPWPAPASVRGNATVTP